MKPAGHFGIARTTERVRRSPYYWPQLRKDVRDWVMRCDLCQRTKPTVRKEIAPLGKLAAGVPMERIAVDVMGPLPETKRGNRFVIVVSDYFTKWTEAYSTKDHKAETVATVLVEQFFSRFGLPRTIHTDQGRDFESHLFKQLCQLLDIEKTRTTPWHPQSDGMVERFNRTLETLLRQTIQTDQSDWDLQIPICCMAYRASVHDTTKQTPNALMLGRELPLPSHLLSTVPETLDRPTNVHQYVKTLEERLQWHHKRAREHTERGIGGYKRQYDKRAYGRPLKEGQFTWLFNTTKKVGRSPKLQSNWEEYPYVVKETLSDLVVQIENVQTKKTRVVHRNQLKLVGDQSRWAKWIAAKNAEAENTRKEASTLPQFGLNHLGQPIRL